MGLNVALWFGLSGTGKIRLLWRQTDKKLAFLPLQ